MYSLLLAVFLLAPALILGVTYSFEDAASLLAAQARGSFNTTEPLVILLQPGVYALHGVVAITAPLLELRGASELRCQASGSALLINVPGSVLLTGLNITMCSGTMPAVTIKQSSNVTLDQLNFHSNTAGALSIVANTSAINLHACSFVSNSLQLFSPEVSANAHAASITLGQGSVSMQMVTTSSNGMGSPAANASALIFTCTNVDPSSCSFNSTNSSWVSNSAGSMAPVLAMTGFGSVALIGAMFENNTGSNSLSVTQAVAAASGISDGTPPRSPGTYNVVLSGARFIGNQGTLYGGVLVISCGSVLIDGSSFIGNGAASLDGGVSHWVIASVCHSYISGRARRMS